MPYAMPTFSSLSKMRALNDGLLPVIGTMLIDSVPPAIITSASPTRMRSAAIATAFNPDEQKRLIVTPPVEFGNPASSTAIARHVETLLAFRQRATDDRVFDCLRI